MSCAHHRSSDHDDIPEEQVMKNLLALMEATNYPIMQENGQRKYGGPCPDWDKPEPPSKSCEVFLKYLPPSCFEDALVPLFASVGKIYEMRLMLDFHGANRGFGFVKYTCPEDAKKAIQRLDHFKLPGGAHRMRVFPSHADCEVLVSNFQSSLSPEEQNKLEDFIRSKTENLEELCWVDQRPLRLVLRYASHKDAAVARRALMIALPDIYGRCLHVILVRKENDKPSFKTHRFDDRRLPRTSPTVHHHRASGPNWTKMQENIEPPSTLVPAPISPMKDDYPPLSGPGYGVSPTPLSSFNSGSPLTGDATSPLVFPFPPPPLNYVPSTVTNYGERGLMPSICTCGGLKLPSVSSSMSMWSLTGEQNQILAGTTAAGPKFEFNLPPTSEDDKFNWAL